MMETTDGATIRDHGPQLRDALPRRRPRPFARLATSLRERARAFLSRRREAGIRPGFVWIVGAGPGDPDLLTLKALHALQQADVIVVDRLVDPRILDLARQGARRIDVGKTPGQPSIAQEEINAILIAEARAGHVVVRLKGGDPFVFGRGGEEVAALDAADIGCIVVPGITAAAACAASARLPLTHREAIRSFTLVTGAVCDGRGNRDWADHDWQALARAGNGFAVYMGVGAAGHLERQFARHGVAPDTPVVVVENGTRANERIVETSAGALHAAVIGLGLKGPALIYVGLHWRQSGIARPAHVEDFDGRAVVALARPAEASSKPAQHRNTGALT